MAGHASRPLRLAPSPRLAEPTLAAAPTALRSGARLARPIPTRAGSTLTSTPGLTAAFRSALAEASRAATPVTVSGRPALSSPRRAVPAIGVGRRATPLVEPLPRTTRPAVTLPTLAPVAVLPPALPAGPSLAQRLACRSLALPVCGELLLVQCRLCQVLLQQLSRLETPFTHQAYKRVPVDHLGVSRRGCAVRLWRRPRRARPVDRRRHISRSESCDTWPAAQGAGTDVVAHLVRVLFHCLLEQAHRPAHAQPFLDLDRASRRTPTQPHPEHHLLPTGLKQTDRLLRRVGAALTRPRCCGGGCGGCCCCGGCGDGHRVADERRRGGRRGGRYTRQAGDGVEVLGVHVRSEPARDLIGLVPRGGRVGVVVQLLVGVEVIAGLGVPVVAGRLIGLKAWRHPIPGTLGPEVKTLDRGRLRRIRTPAARPARISRPRDAGGRSVHVECAAGAGRGGCPAGRGSQRGAGVAHLAKLDEGEAPGELCPAVAHQAHLLDCPKL
mmetsp:Transcript_27409/g.87135  ORF Transcript_27409/g.87135 Transcript_27409/m.87135 type:complete len:497 (+) Transcript_27409:77-1567(+)